MANTASSDMQHLDRNLTDDGPLEWLMSRKPVVAIFSASGKSEYTAYDRSYLGRPSLDEKNPRDGLYLCIGTNKITNKLLITLVQRVRTSSSNKYRLFFLCIPAQSLSLSVADPVFWRLSEDTVPLNIVVDPTEKSLNYKTSRLLRISFKLGARKSQVIMPEYPHTGHVSPHSMSLLRKLKALSEAGSFDLFTNHDSWTQQAFFKVRDMLHNARPSDPIIKYEKFYDAGRNAVIDRWDLQGYFDAQDSTEEDSDTTKLMLERSMKRKRFDRYASMGEDLSDHHPLPTYQPPSVSHSETSAVDDSLLKFWATSPPPVRHASPSSARSASGFKISEMDPINEFGAQSVHRSTVLLHASSDEPLPSSEYHCPQSFDASISDYDPVAICVECSPGTGSSVHELDLTDISMSRVAETPREVLNQLSPTGTNNIRRTTPERLPQLMSIQTVGLWLKELWKRWPYAHYTCITDLLKIGAALRDLNADSYHVARARTLATLLELQMGSSVTVHMILSRRRFVENGVCELISWLLILDPEADMRFCDQLRNLAAARERCRHLVGLEPQGTERYYGLLGSFIDIKASVVLQACMQFGRTVLETDKRISDKMMAEMKRIQI